MAMSFSSFMFVLLAGAALGEETCLDETSMLQVGTSVHLAASTIADASVQDFIKEHFRFENQSAADKFMMEHKSKWPHMASFLAGNASLSNITDEEQGEKEEKVVGTSSLLSVGVNRTERGTCPLKYEDQYFKPRHNLCGDSFTGITSCTESGCYSLSAFFYDSMCHTVYYTNAESTANGYGMCRCMRSQDYSINRYHSGAGNNIYSCSSLV